MSIGRTLFAMAAAIGFAIVGTSAAVAQGMQGGMVQGGVEQRGMDHGASQGGMMQGGAGRQNMDHGAMRGGMGSGGASQSMDPCMMHGGMGSGSMGRGMMMGSGASQGGMMHEGTGSGMMGQHMGRGMMMGSGMSGADMMQGGPRSGMGALFGSQVRPIMNLSIDDVRGYLGMQLEGLNNKRLKLGELKAEDRAITADIVTVDNSLVQRLKVDRRTGAIEYVN